MTINRISYSLNRTSSLFSLTNFVGYSRQSLNFPLKLTKQFYSSQMQKKGLVVGYYNDLSLVASEESIGADLHKKAKEYLELSNAKGKFGETRLLISSDNTFSHVALVSLGEKTDDVNKTKDHVRHANAIGVKALKENGAETISLDNTLSSHAASEGSLLALYKYTSKKASKTEEDSSSADSKDFLTQLVAEKSANSTTESWESGEIYAKAQNQARFWMDSPANLMTPVIFSEQVKELGSKIEGLEVMVRDRAWIEEKKMGSFLSVTQGSSEEPRLVEMHYNGSKSDDKPLAFIGKGITFDSGGISIKPSSNMHHMKADMGGAATVAATVLAIAELKLPINVKACIPLCENMPSANATKPGDVVTAMNGKTIEVLNTDAEGRLVLADALYYLVSTYKPHTAITVATLTGAMVVALGDVFAGTFCSSTDLWKKFENAGESAGDPFWRMPLHEGYRKLMTQSDVADLANIGTSNGGGSCSAAAFLREFVPPKDKEASAPINMNEDTSLQADYAHVDIAGVMQTAGGFGYLTKGMSGRPTRSFIEFSKSFCQK